MHVNKLSRARPTRIDLRPERDELDATVRFLGLASLRELRLKGEITAQGATGWRADLRLTADLEQYCVATLAPVRERIDERVIRMFLPRAEIPETAEIDLSLDDEDDAEAFDDFIDMGLIAVEALALAIDPYPRAVDAPSDARMFAPPGVDPLSDDALNPFAKLATLKENLRRDES